MFHRRSAALVLAGLTLMGGCARAVNYDGPGPRYAGASLVPSPAPACPPDQIRIATFNIAFGRHVDRAVALLRAEPDLREADIVALQEMDAAGTRQVAAALGMSYVYYPAALHPQDDRDFGNAILSRWPIVADRKILLPHLGRGRAMQRAAVAATIDLAGVAVRVYSVHLATQVANGPKARREQAAAVLADAARHERVILAGDLNSHGIGTVFAAGGFAWPTRDQPATASLFNWDHIFLRGLTLAAPDASGVVYDDRDASDHQPVWAVAATGASCDARGVQAVR